MQAIEGPCPGSYQVNRASRIPLAPLWLPRHVMRCPACQPTK